MPLISGLKLDVRPRELYRRALGRRCNGFEAQFEEVVKEVKTGGLLEPRAAYEVHGIKKLSEARLELEGGWALSLEAQMPCFSLKGAQKLVVLAGTIGPKLEGKVRELFEKGEPLKAVIMDGIGNALVDSLRDEACVIAEKIASEEGLEAGSPISPGMPGLDIEFQWEIMKRLPAKGIGLSITRGGVLVPTKSFSSIIAVGKGVSRWERSDICRVCKFRESCPYRRP